MEKVLLVDDEVALATMIRDYLNNEGFDVFMEHTFSSGKEAFDKNVFDAVILDINLPDGSGLDLCKYIRSKNDLPIVMLSARSGDVDKIMGLGLGSDDYITKPFSSTVLSARIKAHINRYNRLKNSNERKDEVIIIKDLTINEKSYEVYLKDNKIEFTAKEFQILNLLASNPNRVFSKEYLFNQIWGFNDFGDTNTVTVHIRKIRSKIEEDSKNPTYIKTVWGVGYKFED